MNPIREMKEEQKKLAAEIRTIRREDKNDWRISSLSRKFRHYHIAYCELRGRIREQIERTTREDNRPDEYWIEKIKATLLNDLDKYNKEQENAVKENVCASA